MNKLTTAALFFLAAGIFTSVSILSGFQILFGISIAYFTYVAIKNKNVQLPKSSYWLLAFTVVALISLTLNYDIIPKPSKNFGRLKYFLFAVGGIFVLRSWIPNTSAAVKKNLFRLFCVSMVVAGGYAAWEVFIKGAERASGLTETMRYGYGSAMALLVLTSAFLHRKKIESWFDPKFAIASIVIGFLGMYVTYTRGALLGFLCGIPFVLYFYKKQFGYIFGGLAILGALGLGGIYLFGSGNYESRFLMSKNNESDVMRRSQWKAAIIAIQERPVLGWGLSNFHTQLKRIKYENDLDAKHYHDAHSHNLFLEVASGTGLIGLFLFLGWLISWAYESFKRDELTRALVVPLGVAFVLASQFEVTLDANNASMIFFVYSLSSIRGKNV